MYVEFATLSSGGIFCNARTLADGLLAEGMNPEVAENAGAIYGHSLLAQAKTYGMSVDSLDRARVIGAEQRVSAGQTLNQSESGWMDAWERLDRDEANFGRTIGAFIGGSLDMTRPIDVMTTPLALGLAGAEILPVRVTPNTLKKILVEKHKLPTEVMKQVPRSLANPVMIFQSATRGDDSLVVMLDMTHEGSSVVVPVALSKKSGHYVVNAIASVYRKDNKDGTPRNEWFVDQIKGNRLRYVNQEKSTAWAQSIGLQLPKEALNDALTNNIPTEADLVNAKNRNPGFYQGESANPKGSITMDRGSGQALIRLFQGADASTIYHELWHLGLDNLLQFGNLPDASEQARSDRGRALEWLGIADIDLSHGVGALGPIDAERYVAAQEKWARGGEKYLATGKAPNKGLQGLFDRIKKWMLDTIEGVAREMDVPADVAEIYGRMIASPIDTNPLWDANTTVEELIDLARQTDEAAEGRGVTLNQEREQGQRSDRLDSMLQAIESDPALKLNSEELVDRYGDGLVAMLPEGIDSPDGKMSVDNLAERFGYDNGDALIDALMGADERALAEMEGRMSRWEYILTADEIARDEAVSPNSRPSVMAWIKNNGKLNYQSIKDRFGPVDGKALLQRLGPGMFSKEGLALDDVAMLMSYEGAQFESAQEVLDVLLGEGPDLQRPLDLAYLEGVEAGRAQVRELVDNYRDLKDKMKEEHDSEQTKLYRRKFREVLQAYDEQVKRERKGAAARYREILENKRKLDRKKKDVRIMLKDILTSTKSKGIYAGTREEIKEMLVGYELDPDRVVTKDMLTGQQIGRRAARRAERTVQQADVIADLIAEDPAFAAEIFGVEGLDRAEILDLLSRTTIDQMTIAELTALYADVMARAEEGRETLRAIQAVGAARRKGQADAAVDSLKRGMPARERGLAVSREETGKQYRGIRGGLEKIKDWTYANTLGMVRLANWFDGGGKEGGIFTEIFVDRANDCRDVEKRNEYARRENVERHMEELGITARKLGQEREVEGITLVGDASPTLDVLLNVYALTKNRRGREALIKGAFDMYADPEAAIAKCIEALSDNEKRFADLIIADYMENFDRINRVLMDVFNISMEREQNYSPLLRLEHAGTAGVQEAKVSGPFGALGGSITDGKNAGLERGFSISRIDLGDIRQGDLRLGLYSIWCDQVSVQEHTAAFAELISDTKALLRNRPNAAEVVIEGRDKRESVYSLLRQKFGDDAWAALQEYNEILTRNDVAIAQSVMNNTSRLLSRNMTVTYLCANVGTMLKQITSLPRFLVAAGPHRILCSLGKFLTGPQAFLNRVYDLDPQMKARAGDVMLEAVRSDPTWGSTGYQRALDIGLAPISYIDRWVAAVGWDAVYGKGIAEGLSVEQAAKRAQRVVLLTQQTVHAKDAPRIWRQSGIARLAMIFTSEAAQTWGMGAYDFVQQIRRGDIQGVLRSITAATCCALLMRMITDGLPDDDGDESWAAWVAGALGTQAVESIPLIGKDMLAMWQELDGSGYFGAQPTAVAAPFTKAIKGAYWLTDDKDTNDERAIWSLIEGLSLLGGRFPVTAGRRLIDAGILLDDDEAVEAALRIIGRRREAKKVIGASVML